MVIDNADMSVWNFAQCLIKKLIIKIVFPFVVAITVDGVTLSQTFILLVSRGFLSLYIWMRLTVTTNFAKLMNKIFLKASAK